MKLERMGIPQDLVNQIAVFLVPLIVQTTGDVTHTVATLTTGLTKGGAASPALFRIFIDDLSGEVRNALGRDGTVTGNSLKDPAKLVADDVVLMVQSDEKLQIPLDTCTAWANRN